MIDRGMIAGKSGMAATSYFPSGAVLDFGNGNMTWTHAGGASPTLTLAGGVLVLPSGTSANPSLQIGSASANFYDNTGLIIGLGASNSLLWVKTAQIEIAQATLLGWGLTGAFDLQLGRKGAAILQQGADAASPVAQTYKGPDATGTNTVGGRINWRPGISTGNAVPAIQFMQGGAATVTSGTGAQAVVDRFTPNAFKVLTNNSAIAVVNATIANGSTVGGFLTYTIEVTDGTDYQVETGQAVYSSQNKAGVIAGTITKINAQQNLSVGTLATTWAISNANPAVISINANSSLVPSTGYPRITFSLSNLGQQAIAIQ